ncbi:hypothetical protein M752DRAFT_267817 [Aspergillus phoenicis ATCC 13157]|uniref:Uncharacterized protein n=1 Tax=Aspergillus phoenicis ATCC 13157 TaxID=1353007 RepID=A0A370PEZ1_ASPPH|nr:hypothetical protein CBS147346_6341 [Aspergillus niger]RDK40751.1 hypothetical protein M752DRAFT_267817 [Aspergillus phoenicis ATCC 13157]GLA22092.1 hypothetical protein AnigIFM63326_000224 [Aspergillus niger]
MTNLKSSIHNSPLPSLEDERYNEIEGVNYTAGYVKQLSSDDELLAGAWGMKDTTEIWDLCYRSGPRMTKILEDFVGCMKPSKRAQDDARDILTIDMQLFGWSQDISYISIFDDTEPPKVDWDKVTMSNVIGITAIWTLHEMARIKPAMFRHTYQYIPGERNPFKLDPYDLLHGIMLLRWVLRTWNFDRDQQPDRPRPLRAKERRFWRPKARDISFAPLPEPEDSEMMDVD